jgi:group I intron endonuclease
MSYIVYKTTNTVNGKYYIGKHNLHSEYYLGSGSVLQRAIKKYGRNAFVREVLFECETEEEAYLKESELLTEEVLNDPQCYNLRTGGQGAYTWSDELREKMSRIHKGRPKSEEHKKRIGDSNRGKIVSEEARTNMSRAQKGQKKSPEFCRRRSELVSGEKNPMYGKGHLVAGEKNPMYGKKHSDETRRKISEKGSGKNHSQYGMIWITNGTEARKIKKTDDIPAGWKRGRK